MSKSKNIKNNEIHKQIILMLPYFINQLLLLLNSGVLLQDAISQIAQDYGKYDKDRQNYFTTNIYELYRASNNSGENIIVCFYRFSRESGVKELNRVATVLIENKNKGTDLWDKLSIQSDMLWEERKRSAFTMIKKAESKMSFPLAMLLLALIIITAAPAFLQMT